MGMSRVDYNGETLIDISNDTVTPDTLAEGKTAHNANGDPIVGTMVASEGGNNMGSNIYDVNAVGRLSVDFERFIITITAIHNIDKTVEEIVAAAHAGKTVFLHVDISDSYKENAGIPPENPLVGIAHFQLVYSSSLPEVIFCAMNDFSGSGVPVITRIGGAVKSSSGQDYWTVTSQIVNVEN